MSAPAVAVNGRFRHLEPGGYRRYASEVCDRLTDATVVQPSPRNARGLRGRTWEQAVLAHRTSDQVLLSPAGSGPLRHRRHVVVVHDLLPLEHPEWFSARAARAQQRLLPSLLARARRVVVPSVDVAERMGRRFPDVAAKTTVVAPAVGTPFDRPPDPARVTELTERLGLAPDQPLIGGLVAASARKNSARLLQVLAEAARRTGAAVAVAGHTDHPRVVAGEPRPHHSGVVDLGALDDDDLAAFYGLMTVFVSLSLGEGYGMPVAEAASCGPAIVTSPVPAATELLDGQCIVVDPDDPGSTLDAIDQALRDHSAADTITRQATARRWTWPDASARINHVLEELTN